MNKQIIYFAFLVILSGCVTSERMIKIDQFESVQEFRVNTKRDTTIVGLKGTSIFIPKLCFEKLNGEIVTDSVVVLIEEYYKKSEMILRGLSTTSNNLILISNGMINIRALSLGSRILIGDSSFLDIHNPFKTDTIYDPFIAKNPDSSRKFNWEKTDSIVIKGETIEFTRSDSLGGTIIEVTYNPNNYFFRTERLGFVNFDIYLKYQRGTDLCVRIPKKNPEARVYLAFKKFKSIIEGEENGEFYLFKNIPADLDAYIVAIEMQGLDFKYEIKDGIYQKDTLNINYKIASAIELKKAIEGIDY